MKNLVILDLGQNLAALLESELKKRILHLFFQDSHNERVVDRLPLMTYGLKLSLEALILKFKNFDLRFKEII